MDFIYVVPNMPNEALKLWIEYSVGTRTANGLISAPVSHSSSASIMTALFHAKCCFKLIPTGKNIRRALLVSYHIVCTSKTFLSVALLPALLPLPAATATAMHGSREVCCVVGIRKRCNSLSIER